MSGLGAWSELQYPFFFPRPGLLTGAAVRVTGTLDRRDGGHLLAHRVRVRDGNRRVVDLGNERLIRLLCQKSLFESV